LGYPTAESIA
jgi:hypothetical protein